MKDHNKKPSNGKMKPLSRPISLLITSAVIILAPLFPSVVFGLITQDTQSFFMFYCMLTSLLVALSIGYWIINPYLLLPETVKQKIIELLISIGVRAISIVPVGILLRMVLLESQYSWNVKLIALIIAMVCSILAFDGIYKDENNAKLQE